MALETDAHVHVDRRASWLGLGPAIVEPESADRGAAAAHEIPLTAPSQIEMDNTLTKHADANVHVHVLVQFRSVSVEP
jgi:hypothetical protein